MPGLNDTRVQRGGILTGWLPGLILVACAGVGLFRILPVYVDHNYLVSSTRSLLESRSATTLSQTELRREIGGSLRRNNIEGVDVNSLVLLRSGTTPAVRIEYERRVPFVSNIEFAIRFDETVD